LDGNVITVAVAQGDYVVLRTLVTINQKGYGEEVNKRVTVPVSSTVQGGGKREAAGMAAG
jgi:hypothetical protein